MTKQKHRLTKVQKKLLREARKRDVEALRVYLEAIGVRCGDMVWENTDISNNIGSKDHTSYMVISRSQGSELKLIHFLYVEKGKTHLESVVYAMILALDGEPLELKLDWSGDEVCISPDD